MRWLALMLVGCGSQVKGEVDGEKPTPIRSSFWYAVGEGDNAITAVQLYSFGSSCKNVAAYYGATADAYASFSDSMDVDGLVADLDAAEQDNFPSEYWNFSFTLVEAPGDKLMDTFTIEDKELAIGALHQFDYNDYEKIKKELNNDGYHARSYASDGGTVEVKQFKEAGVLSGTADFALLDLEGKDAGTVTASLSAPYCSDVETAYAHYLEVLAGLGG